MDKFDKNFHLNFSPLYAVFVFMMFMLWASEAKGEEVEEVLVVGAVIEETISEPSQDFNIIETIMPTVSFVGGGYGGFSGFSERGTEISHTSVFRNGVPVNDAGSGWYDFAHDIATGLESVKLVNGANSVLYGSSSMGGTVFITDTFENQAVVRYGSDHELLNVVLFDSLSLTSFDVSNGSVKTDNTEEDWYKNSTVKFGQEWGGVKVNLDYTDYNYDYDECYNEAFQATNNCLQTGEKGTLSIRNDKFTIGYSQNVGEYYSDQVQTWESIAERGYFDYKETLSIGTPAATLIFGATAEYEEYADADQTTASVYSSLAFGEQFQVGIRVAEDALIGRVGWQLDGLFFNLGNSYRKPTLYELIGDAWTMANPDLEPEEGYGLEFGWRSLSIFTYNFSEGIDYDFDTNQFINVGEYETQGIRYNNVLSVPWGGFKIFVAYTDSDQLRIPEFKTELGYFASVNGWKFHIDYNGMFERGSDFTGIELDDVQSIDLGISREFGKLNVSLSGREILDDAEVIPGYFNGGSQYFLTFTYR